MIKEKSGGAEMRSRLDNQAEEGEMAQFSGERGQQAGADIRFEEIYRNPGCQPGPARPALLAAVAALTSFIHSSFKVFPSVEVLT